MKGSDIVDYCANPQCKKPLHYLREGTVYLFEVLDSGPRSGNALNHRLEHYWLCGDCSALHLLERTPNKEIHLIPKQNSHERLAGELSALIRIDDRRLAMPDGHFFRRFHAKIGARSASRPKRDRYAMGENTAACLRRSGFSQAR